MLRSNSHAVQSLLLQERRLARRLELARRELRSFFMVLSCAVALLAVLPFWDAPSVGDVRALVATMSTMSLICLVWWFVSNLIVLPVRLRSMRARRAALDGAGNDPL